MTTFARSHRPAQIDVRCSAVLPQTASDEGRCQLFAGHDGPHAVMFTHCGKRLVRTWRSNNPAVAADVETDALQRPWMYGYPAPAWFETESGRAS